MSDVDEEARDAYWRSLRLPPFASDEPIDRFEAAVGVKLPEDLRTYLRTESRQVDVDSPSLDGAMFYETELAEMTTRTLRGAGALSRVCPPGTLRREMFDRICGGDRDWRHFDKVPYLIVFEQLTTDPSAGTETLRPVNRIHIHLRSLASCMKETFGMDVETFMVRAVEVTGATRAQLDFEDVHDVVVIPLTNLGFDGFSEVGWFDVGLVVSPGPFEGWFFGNHGHYVPKEDDYMHAAFPSFAAYCAYWKHRLVSFHPPKPHDVAKEAAGIAEVRRLVQARLDTGIPLVAPARIIPQSPDTTRKSQCAWAMPPFASEGPILRFEAAAGIRLPDDLRTYLLTVSREFPIERDDYKSHRSGMLYKYRERECLNDVFDAPFEAAEHDCDQLMNQLVPPGSRVDALLQDLQPDWHSRLWNDNVRTRIMNALAFAEISEDLTRGTTYLKAIKSVPMDMYSIGENIMSWGRGGGGPLEAAKYVCALLASTSMTLDQLVFPQCKVQALLLSTFDVVYGEMWLVTSEGPFHGWIIASNTCMQMHSYVTVGFPSFTAYRDLREMNLDFDGAVVGDTWEYR